MNESSTKVRRKGLLDDFENPVRAAAIGVRVGSARDRPEPRKGRIQRIGQIRDEIWIANLRYRNSVEDRVHTVLADRLEAIHDLFGQIPDTLEDVWVQVARNDEHAANQLIDRTAATRNPFDVNTARLTMRTGKNVRRS